MDHVLPSRLDLSDAVDPVAKSSPLFRSWSPLAASTMAGRVACTTVVPTDDNPIRQPVLGPGAPSACTLSDRSAQSFGRPIPDGNAMILLISSGVDYPRSLGK